MTGSDPRESRLLVGHRLLTDAVSKLTTSADWRAMLDIARRLPRYSPANCLLLAVQGAQGMVMGYHAWRQIPSVDGGSCQVRRGSRGLSILAPSTRVVREHEPDGTERVIRRLEGFRRATVFDEHALVAAPDLPDLLPQQLQGQAPDRLADAVTGELADTGYRLISDGPAADAIAPAYGRVDLVDRTVTIRTGLNPAQQAKTLVHELAHTRMHGQDDLGRSTRAVAEVEAESVAYLVLGEYGLDTSDYTLPYLAHWSGGGAGMVLLTARRTVDTARGVLATLERRLGIASQVLDSGPPAEGQREPDWLPPLPPTSLIGPDDAGVGL